MILPTEEIHTVGRLGRTNVWSEVLSYPTNWIFSMRRALLVAALGGIMLTGAGCSSDAHPSNNAAPSTTPAFIEPSSAAPDFSANTKDVCGRLEKVFNEDLAGFGAQLGKMIAYKEAGQTAEADKAKKAAQGELKGVADKVRNETSAAQDPEFQAAGQQSADKFLKSANDASFINKIKSTKDVDRNIQAQMTEWLTPVAGFCA